MRNYELVVVLDGKVTQAKKKSFEEKTQKLVTSVKGKIDKVKELGVKDLAYKIKKSETGLYLVFPLELTSEAVKVVAEKFRLDTEVIRYLIIRKD